MTDQDPTNRTAARPRLTVDVDAVAANWRLFRDTAPGAETAAVVKADAYGLGVADIAPRLYAEGARSFFVANADEGADVRNVLGADRDAAIYVLSGVLPGEQDRLLAHRLTPVLNAPWQLDLWRAARAQGADAASVLHIDTGIHRLGAPLAEIDAVLEPERLNAAGVAMVMSHLACAATPEHPLNATQLRRFQDIVARVRAVAPQMRFSLCNSAGVLNGPDYHFDLIRPGIGLYGGQPLDAGGAPVRCAVTLDAPILQVSRVQPGDTIGYGADHEVDAPRTTATVALGYADGFLRAGGGRGYGVLGGIRTPILGRVSMDLITVDVTHAREHAAPGALITFLGEDPTLDAVARAAGTVNYEVLTRLGPRCVRTVTGGAA